MTTIHMERSSEKKTRNSNQKNTDVKWIIVCLLGQIETYDGTFQSIQQLNPMRVHISAVDIMTDFYTSMLEKRFAKPDVYCRLLKHFR